jgi:uncharacterized protein (DUF433 family)
MHFKFIQTPSHVPSHQPNNSGEINPKFLQWKANLVTDSSILGGETVFPNSRLSVNRIGMRLKNGESTAVIKEDYPYLSDDDLKFSLMYIEQAH